MLGDGKRRIKNMLIFAFQAYHKKYKQRMNFIPTNPSKKNLRIVYTYVINK